MKTKTLYISDLDGTLLASDGHISDRSRNILNKVIKDGAKVSIEHPETYLLLIKELLALIFRFLSF